MKAFPKKKTCHPAFLLTTVVPHLYCFSFLYLVYQWIVHNVNEECFPAWKWKSPFTLPIFSTPRLLFSDNGIYKHIPANHLIHFTVADPIQGNFGLTMRQLCSTSNNQTVHWNTKFKMKNVQVWFTVGHMKILVQHVINQKCTNTSTEWVK